MRSGRVFQALAASLSIYMRDLFAVFADLEDTAGQNDWKHPRCYFFFEYSTVLLDLKYISD